MKCKIFLGEFFTTEKGGHGGGVEGERPETGNRKLETGNLKLECLERECLEGDAPSAPKPQA